jgi:hypothetical protein
MEIVILRHSKSAARPSSQPGKSVLFETLNRIENKPALPLFSPLKGNNQNPFIL